MRSQRHMVEVQGVNSSGDIGPGGGPGPASIAPNDATIAAVGAVGRVIATMVTTGGQGPYHYSIDDADGLAAEFVGAELRTTINPAGTVALHTVLVRVRDQRGSVEIEDIEVTLS